MREIIKKVLVTLFIVFAVIEVNAADKQVSVNGYRWSYTLFYNSDSGLWEAEISSVYPATGDMTIPESIDDDWYDCVLVTRIKSSAFANCSGLTKVTIPGVDVIGDHAFEGCSGLEHVTISCTGNQGLRIGDYAFASCSSLESVEFSWWHSVNYADGYTPLEYIGTSSFDGCPKLTTFKAPLLSRSRLQERYSSIFGSTHPTITYLCKVGVSCACVWLEDGDFTVPYGSSIGTAIETLPDCQSYDSYHKYLGWYIHTPRGWGDKVTADTIVLEDIEIVNRCVAAWTVTLNANGGKLSGASKIKIAKGKAVGTLKKPVRAGYTFKGWYTKKSGGTKITSKTKVKKNVTYYAHWTVKKYTVKLKKTGKGTVSGGCKKAYKSKITLRAKPSKGYVFIGWYKGGVFMSGKATWKIKIPLNGATYTAVFKKKGSASARDKVQLWEGGPYWATTNIGAMKPEDCGYYFWWGDTVGYRRENGKWVASDGSSSNYSFNENNTPTYDKDFDTLKSQGWITSDGVLVPTHDAAHVHWGGNWRMPTVQELSDLVGNCDWIWTTRNGVQGYAVKGKGAYASASIFLPCVGYGSGTSLSNADPFGGYWSSVPTSVNEGAWRFYLYAGGRFAGGSYRYCGQSVRPVQGFNN